MKRRLQSIPCQGSLFISDLEFLKAVCSDETRNRVSKHIAKLCGKSALKSDSPKFTTFLDPIEGGTVRPVTVNTRTIIASSAGFPLRLAQENLSAEESVEVASVYVHSFGIIFNGMQQGERCGRRVNLKIKDKPSEAVWSPEFLVGPHSIPYRAAGTVVSQAFGISISVSGPVPPHIAGIYEPLHPDTFRQLHSVLK